MVITRQNEYQAPHDYEAEAAVLGSLLIDGDALHRVLSIIKPEDFYRARNRYCFAACIAASGRQEAVDQITVARELSRQDLLETVGGTAYLGHLIANTPTSVNVEYYAGIVADTAAKRRIIAAGDKIAGLGYADAEDAGETLRQAVDILFSLQPGQTQRGFRHISEAYDRFLQGDDIGPAVDAARAIPTGLAELDDIITGLNPSDLIILGARPGFGKSSLALNICVAAAKKDCTAAVYSLEMSIEQVAARILAAETGIDSRRLSSGLYSEAEEHRIVECIGYLSGLPIYVDDTPMQTVAQMHAKAQRLQMEHGLELLTVDYLQLIQSPRACGHISLAQMAKARIWQIARYAAAVFA